MNINLEATEKYSIQSYDASQVKIDSVIYTANLIVSKQRINFPWPIDSIEELNPEQLQPFLVHQPEIILIGHPHIGKFPSPTILQLLNSHRIGLEFMSIGAACRTYNVLLCENRKVVLGLIFN